MSYYPHNQPIVAIGTESDSTDRTAFSQSVTGTLADGTIVERSLAGSPVLDGQTTYQPGYHQRNPTLDQRVAT